MRTALVTHPLDAGALLAEVSRTANGAAVLFAGTVRELNDGRAVSGIEYAAYQAMAERELTDIVADACRRFETNDIVAEHRLGQLELGEASVVVVAAHPHREAAFDAARFVVEELKRRVPIWKLEQYVDGTREWVHGGRGTRDEGRVESTPDVIEHA